MRKKARTLADERPYRCEINLPRDLNAKLEEMKKEVKGRTGKRISKSALLVEIVREFFDKTS